MQWIANFFTTLLSKITQFATAIGQWFQAVINTIKAAAQFVLDVVMQVFIDTWEMVTDSAVWVFHAVLSIASGAVAALDLSGISSAVGAFGQLPAEILNMLGLIGAGQALAVILSALIIRMALQLIPFVRLGS